MSLLWNVVSRLEMDFTEAWKVINDGLIFVYFGMYKSIFFKLPWNPFQGNNNIK